MQDGNHNPQHLEQSIAIWVCSKLTVEHRSIRQRDAWIKKCQDCHSPRFAADKLKEMDDGVRLSLTKWRKRQPLSLVASRWCS